MTAAVFTLGYSGRSVEEIAAAVEERDALLFDIRLVARSRDPRWSGKQLRERFGERYRHVPALGNLNYKSGGPVALSDAEAGLAVVEEAIGAGQAVVLLCACKDAATCHRAAVAALLRGRGYTVTEVAPARE